MTAVLSRLHTPTGIPSSSAGRGRRWSVASTKLNFCESERTLPCFFIRSLQNYSACSGGPGWYFFCQGASTKACPPSDQGLANASATNTLLAAALTIIHQQTTMRSTFPGEIEFSIYDQFVGSYRKDRRFA